VQPLASRVLSHIIWNNPCGHRELTKKQNPETHPPVARTKCKEPSRIAACVQFELGCPNPYRISPFHQNNEQRHAYDDVVSADIVNQS